MKVLREICLSILIAFFLISGVTYAQSPATKSYYRKGVEYGAQGKFTKAKVEFKKALKIDPFYRPAISSLETIKDVLAQKIKKETAIYTFKGFSYGHKGNVYRAIQKFTKAIENDPKYAVAYANRGFAYAYQGQYDRAIRDHTKAIEIDPKYARAYHGRGLAYGDNDEYDRTIRDHTKAIEIDPKYAIAYENRGSIYLVARGNKAKGCADFKMACKLGKCRNYTIVKLKGYCK